MEPLDYESLKDMMIHNLILVLLFATTVASADVSISNAYYAGELECRENLFLHNMDYSNSAHIDSGGFNAASNAVNTSQSGTGRLVQDARMLSALGSQGASIAISAEKLRYSRSLYGGRSQFIGLSYFLESGTAQANYFTPRSLFDERMTLANCRYDGVIQVYDRRSYSSGVGSPIRDAPSSFFDNISMIYLDKQCKLWSRLVAFGESEGDIPVRYKWRSYSGERDYARAGIGISANQGNRYMNLGINGTASFLGDKSSPDPKKSPFDTFPLQYKPIGQGTQASRDLLVEFVMKAGTPMNLSD